MREKVNARARELGLEVDITTLERPTRTVQEAASAVGCKDAEIVDCAEVRQATPDEVRVATGFSVGGVAPFGHDLPVVLDQTLLDHEHIWAAGGDGNTLFCVKPQKL